MQRDQILWQKEPQKYAFAKKKCLLVRNYLTTGFKYSHRGREGKKALKNLLI